MVKFYKYINDKSLLTVKVDVSDLILPVLEVHLTDHCNLNCKGCSHFSNISDEFFLDKNDFERDLKELCNKFKIYSIKLMGGEPLLHPEITEIVSICKNISPISQIDIISNGILLPSLQKDKLDYIKNNANIILSKYPVNSDKFSQYLDLTDTANRQNRMIYIRNSFRKYINLNGNSNIKNAYSKCIMKQCTTLYNGHLYNCPFALYVKYFNKKFNQNISVSQGIDIYKSTPRQILKYLNKPIETCKYCTFDNDQNASFAWEQSKGLMEEWVLK